MITKLATFKGVTDRGDPLVRVFRQGDSVNKVAGTLVQPIQDWLGTYKSDARKIAILVNALGASEFWGQNVNGDIFPEGALIHDCRCHPGQQHPVDDFTGKVVPPYGYWTFLNAFPYVHHRNKDPSRAFGAVNVSCWNPGMKRVELVVTIDRHLAMQHGAQHIVDRIDRGEYPDVSMGSRVPYDRCTVCNHKSKTRADYCSCVKNIGMGKILDDGRQIGVINDYPRFFDISFVFIGADKTAKMMCKLGAAGAPQSVLDAERVYNFEETPDGLIKAACGRKGGCSECHGKCKVSWEAAGNYLIDGKLTRLHSGDKADLGKFYERKGKKVRWDRHGWEWSAPVTAPARRAKALTKTAEPRIAGVSSEESDRILSGLRGAAAGAVQGHTPADAVLKAARGAAVRLSMTEAKGGPLKVRGVPKRMSQKREAQMAKKLLKKVSAEQSQFTAEVYSEGTGEPSRHKRLTRETEDGQSKTTLERLAPPPPVSNTLYGREDPQDEEGTRLLPTNEDTPTDGVDDDTKLSAAFKKEAKIVGEGGGTSSGEKTYHTEFRTGKRFKYGDDFIVEEMLPTDSDIKRRKAYMLRSSKDGQLLAQSGTDDFGSYIRLAFQHTPKEHRRKGYGTSLLAAVGRLNPDKKIVAVPDPFMDRSTSVEDLTKFYKKSGFGVAGDYGDGRPLMVRASYNAAMNHHKEKSAAFKMGPPPSPNRDKYPFVGTINFRGLLIYVENASGTWRTGPGWKTLMKVPYGEFARSLGTDGDKLDVYVGPDRNCENVFIVHQNHVRGPKKGEYDEDKVMLGFNTAAQAKKAYLAHYDSPKFFRSMTTMAFPLFKKALLRREVDGEKVAMEKTAESLRLEDLFDSATTENSVRRERTWRDKTTNKETNVTGSGMGSWEKTKTAGYLEKEIEYTRRHGDIPDAKTRWKLRSPAEQKVYAAKIRKLNEEGRRRTEAARARLRAEGKPIPTIQDLFKKASARVCSPMDLYKLSTEDKEAAKRKWAEIIKQVGPSKAVGQTSPLLSESEPCIPRETLDVMGAKGLESALATPSLMGMVLKPREFQRISLVHMGKKDLADQLDDAGACFRPRMGEEGPCSGLEPHHADMGLLKMLLPLLSQRSYYGPVVKRRIIRITMVKPESPPQEKEVDSPLLSKVAAAYNWYRREQMKVAASSLGVVESIPELHAGVHGIDDADLFKGAAPDGRTMGMMLGAVPLTLMYSAHLRSEVEKGNRVGTVGRFVADHPWLTTLATVAGTRALMETPAVRKRVDEGLRRAGEATSALRGKEKVAKA